MNKLREIFLDHRGYLLSGTVEILVKDDTQPTSISMHPIFIPKKVLSHTRIKRSINAGNLMPKNITRVLGAKVNISDVYGFAPDYNQFNRTIFLDEDQCKEIYQKPE